MPTPAVGRLRGRSSCDNPTLRSTAACYQGCRRTEGCLLPANGFLAVGAGASFGAWLRWALGLWLSPIFPTVPLGTLCANLLGGFIIGGVTSAADPLEFPPAVRLLVVTGFPGQPYYLLDLLRGDHDATAAGALHLGTRGDIHACRRLVMHDHAGSLPHPGSPGRINCTKNQREGN